MGKNKHDPTKKLYWGFCQGVLTVSGEGAITGSVWSEYCPDIKVIVIKEGVESIAEGAFIECNNLSAVFVHPKCQIAEGAFPAQCKVMRKQFYQKESEFVHF